MPSPNENRNRHHPPDRSRPAFKSRQPAHPPFASASLSNGIVLDPSGQLLVAPNSDTSLSLFQVESTGNLSPVNPPPPITTAAYNHYVTLVFLTALASQ